MPDTLFNYTQHRQFNSSFVFGQSKKSETQIRDAATRALGLNALKPKKFQWLLSISQRLN